MFEDKNKYEITIADYESARDFLKSIGEWDRVQNVHGAFAGRFIIDEANRIKSGQIILTE